MRWRAGEVRGGLRVICQPCFRVRRDTIVVLSQGIPIWEFFGVSDTNCAPAELRQWRAGGVRSLQIAMYHVLREMSL
jgi:hypothetical protein